MLDIKNAFVVASLFAASAALCACATEVGEPETEQQPAPETSPDGVDDGSNPDQTADRLAQDGTAIPGATTEPERYRTTRLY
jgi:hypothetical protein